MPDLCVTNVIADSFYVAKKNMGATRRGKFGMYSDVGSGFQSPLLTVKIAASTWTCVHECLRCL